METQNRNIDWTKSLKKFASVVWGIGTYLGLLVAVAWFAIATGNKSPWQMTLTTVWLSTWLNWMAFLALDRSSNNR
jgi:hypothetical protein